jgi:hypothetical protein
VLKTIEQVRSDISASYEALHNWRKVAAIYHLQPSIARLVAVTSYQPGRKVAAILGVAPRKNVKLEVIVGTVPDGTQVIAASKCVQCGRWYISNSPRRKKCFMCSHYRGHPPKTLN